MRVIAKFENGNPVIVERYEKDVKVGARRLYINDYIGSLIGELPIADVVHHIIERDEEYKDYLDSLESDHEFSTFLVQTMKYAEKYTLGKNEGFQNFLKYALQKINLLNAYGPEIESIFSALIHQIKELPGDPIYIELLDELLKRVISIDTKHEVLARVFPTIIKMSKEMEIPQLREWFELALPHIDPLWLLEALGRLEEVQEMLIGEMELPKNCVVTQLTTKRKIYVLEIPKSRFRVKFHDISYDDVGHPRMACILHVQDKRVTSMKLVAVPDSGDIGLTTPIYHYPYSNVFKDGEVCWNGYRSELINSGRELSALPLLFLSGTNNTHLKDNVRKLFNHYQGKDFSAEQLVPFGKSLKQMMQ